MLQASIRFFELSGLTWLVPVANLCAGKQPRHQLSELAKFIVAPLIAILMFLLLWSGTANSLVTSLGKLPGPSETWSQFENLITEHKRERTKENAFYERQEARNQKRVDTGKTAKPIRQWTGKPTFFDQIGTSLVTVLTGFVMASLIAVPLGIVCGLSRTVNDGLNPLIQIFRPVSPLAWLPIVTMVVSAVYVSDDPMMSKSFVTSAITVTLCSLWPTLVNTSTGVAGIDKDLLNVSRVLQLNWFTTVRKVVIPASLPMIFTGLRLSLSVGWMVLIAAEMLAQNPGLGKFVWDEFQNGSSSSLARILVAVFTIGFIGFLLDRIMHSLQALFSHKV